MNSVEASQDLVTRIAKSMMFRTFARIYENEFGVPLFLESSLLRQTVRTPSHETGFCAELNGKHKSCTGCACRIFPPADTLMPWTWSAPCRAGLQGTMVPLLVLGKPIAWLVSGQYLIGEAGDGTRSLPNGVLCKIKPDKQRHESLNRTFSEVAIIPKNCHDMMVRFLETCCALIGADLNHFLTNDGEKSQRPDGTQWEAAIPATEIADDEIKIRFRLEKVRRHFLRTAGKDTDIACAAKEAGWANHDDFRRDFQDCFAESPSEHWKRVTGLWHTFSEILSDCEQELVEAP